MLVQQRPIKSTQALVTHAGLELADDGASLRPLRERHMGLLLRVEHSSHDDPDGVLLRCHLCQLVPVCLPGPLLCCVLPGEFLWR